MKAKSLLAILFVASLVVACSRNNDDPSNESVYTSTTMPDNEECYYYAAEGNFYNYLFFCYSRTLGGSFDEALAAFQNEYASSIGKAEYNTILDTLTVKDAKAGVVYIRPYFTDKADPNKVLFYPDEALDTEGKCYNMTSLPD